MMQWMSYSSLLICALYAPSVISQDNDKCNNKRDDCHDLANQGYCESHRQQMLEACPRICQFCSSQQSLGVPSPNNANKCIDQCTCCKHWARSGMCRSQEQRMRGTCPESCNFCEQPRPTQQHQTITDPDFECGLPYDQKSQEGRRSRFVRQARPRPQQGSSTSRQDNINTAGTQTKDVKVEDTICGATVIHPRFLLTAAHCVLDPTRPVRTVRLGELDFSQDNESNSRPADYEIERIIVHQDFDPNLVERYNDVALLQTLVPIEFNEFVYPYCLTPIRPPPKALVTGSGFGKVNATSHSPILQEAELNIVSLTECEAAYRQQNLEGVLRGWYPNLLQERDVMCAGHPGRGACEGDGGGPLFMVDQNGRRILVGVVSIAMACRGTQVSKLPGIYVSIADHIDFIDSVLYHY